MRKSRISGVTRDSLVLEKNLASRGSLASSRKIKERACNDVYEPQMKNNHVALGAKLDLISIPKMRNKNSIILCPDGNISSTW